MYKIVKNMGTKEQQETGYEFYLDNAIGIARDEFNDGLEGFGVRDIYSVVNESGKVVKIIPSFKE